jgi:hypothetical protein
LRARQQQACDPLAGEIFRMGFNPQLVQQALRQVNIRDADGKWLWMSAE